MTAADWLTRARAVTDGATPGPWEMFESSTLSAGCLGVDDSNGGMVLWHHDHGIVGGLAADATFIAESRTLLPAAVAAIEAVLALAQYVLDTESDLEGQTASEARWSVAYAIRHTLTAALDPS